MTLLDGTEVELDPTTVAALLAGAAALDAAAQTLRDAAETHLDLRLASDAGQVARQASQHADRLRQLAGGHAETG